MKIKPIRFYLILMALAVAAYSLSLWHGYAFYNDKVEKNTEYNGSRGRSGYINRFYHK